MSDPTPLPQDKPKAAPTVGRKHRRFLRFGLATLLAFVTVVAIACGWAWHRVHDHANQLVVASKIAGNVTPGELSRARPTTANLSVTIGSIQVAIPSGWEKDLADLFDIPYTRDVITLGVLAPSNRSIRLIQDLPRLERLTIQDFVWTDSLFQELKKLKQVKKVYIYVPDRRLSESDEHRFVELSGHLPDTELIVACSEPMERGGNRVYTLLELP